MENNKGFKRRQAQVINWFDYTFGITHSYRRNNYLYYYATCPDCHKERLVLNSYNFHIKCWKCFAFEPAKEFCKDRGYDYNYKQFKGITRPIREKFVVKHKYANERIIPLKAKPLYHVSRSHAAYKYLKEERGLPNDVIEYLQLVLWVQDEYGKHTDGHNYGGRLIVPMTDQFGDVTAFTARDFTGTQYKHKVSMNFDKKEELFNRMCLNQKDPLKFPCMFEGSFDSSFMFHRGGGTNTIDIGDKQFDYMRICKSNTICFVHDVGKRQGISYQQDWINQLRKGFVNCDKTILLASIDTTEYDLNGIPTDKDTDVNEKFKETKSRQFLDDAIRDAAIIVKPVINFFT